MPESDRARKKLSAEPGAYEDLRQEYERPNLPFRCGREALWQRPCRSGPKADGACGGTSECRPHKSGQRFECRRAASAGGPCPDGPRPDGSCSLTRPPCLPSRSLRSLRGRLAWLTFGAVAAALLLSAAGCGRGERMNPADPGPLSAVHARFTRDNEGKVDCSRCHPAHGRPPGEWLAAALGPNDWSKACSSCHRFDGRESQAHNTLFADRPDLEPTQCRSCHTEHKGTDFDITRRAELECSRCHKRKFESFAEGHPAFGADFPYQSKPELRFDHAAHFKRHFKATGFAKVAPRGCAACHDVQAAARQVRPMSFERTCAACHADKIKNDLILIAGDSSLNEPTAFEAYLLASSSASDARARFYQDIAKDGAEAVALAIRRRGGEAAARKMLLGLNDEMLKGIGADWARGKEFKPPLGVSLGNWYYDDGSKKLSYSPREHADTVLRAWAEFSLQAVRSAKGPAERSAARAMVASFFPARRPEGGTGSCGKCHALAAKDWPHFNWRFSGASSRRFGRFSHPEHLRLAELRDCTSCHRWRDKVASAPAPAGHVNFTAIAKETCLQCHAPGKVSSSCLSCHTYHSAPSTSPLIAGSR